jgi:type IV pilus assembly protein PilF|tara:strand:- start:83 stop:871 length:789 start_codon:yes stop_codon:yes gene_type:complete
MELLLKRCCPVILVVLGILQSGCASTQSGVSSKDVDKKTAYHQHINLAKQYIGANQRGLARLHLTNAQKYIDTNYEDDLSKFFSTYALLYQMELEFELAEEYFGKAIKSDPNDSATRYNYSWFLFKQERFADALKQILIVSRDVSYRRRPQAFLIAGLTQKELEDSDAALQSFERAIDLAPQFNAAYLEAAKVYFERQSYLLAKDAIVTYISISGETAESLWLLTRIQLKIGDAPAMTESGDRLNTLFADSEQAGRYRALVQ